jgi:hypothetical protein
MNGGLACSIRAFSGFPLGMNKQIENVWLNKFEKILLYPIIRVHFHITQKRNKDYQVLPQV